MKEIDKHPKLRYYDYMLYMIKREDVVKKTAEDLLPFIRQHNLRVDWLLDDIEEEISHIVRGEDHISNTPKQLLIYQALGFDYPSFAHLPMILGEDKKKLSKRHGAESVESYRDNGFQSAPLIN